MIVSDVEPSVLIKWLEIHFPSFKLNGKEIFDIKILSIYEAKHHFHMPTITFNVYGNGGWLHKFHVIVSEYIIFSREVKINNLLN